MWIVAGVLLGVVVLTAAIGFHSGAHAHLAAGAVGLLAAAWLVAMAVTGRSVPLLWALLTADLVVSAGVGYLAWSGLSQRTTVKQLRSNHSLEGAEGDAVSDLTPDGLVRVHGEQWSAVSLNGTVRAGTRVQVLRAGVRLEVWGDDADVLTTRPLFSLDADSKEDSNP
jgi:membrane-bound ClpP family serine protease